MSFKVFNQSEAAEKKYLEKIKNKLHQAIEATDEAVNKHAKKIQESKDYLWDNKTGMDHVEKVSVRESITQMALTGENAVEKKKRLAKLIDSPYFGRIDFYEAADAPAIPLYIGIHSFFDTTENQNLIHDWRAPVSSMFYDFELGDAYFYAPSGKINGTIPLKRQYRIRKGKMQFMLENALNIHDDVLQKELSQTSSEKMKNIVATIQRDQNAIIRNEESRVLIIQGVAGSGKTSIALHRIAFLLYRFKETIKSEDILIISPNNVFADYISNVLPELGEEKIGEICMEELANNILENKYKFQSFHEQVSRLLQKPDAAFQNRIQFKSDMNIINKINEFLVYIENHYFKPVDFVIKRYPVPAVYIAEKFKTYSRLPLLRRIPQVVEDIVNDLNFYNKYQVNAAERNQIRKEIKKMFKTLNLRQLYKDFYNWLGKPEMLKQAKGSIYEYADVYPLIYLKIKLEGTKTYQKVKHLVIDEMQDYTPVQYSVIAKLFTCNKTILGDCNQAVNPYSSSNKETIGQVFPNADHVKMVKSYRSTFEVTSLAQKIRFNPDIELIERHGDKPTISLCQDEQDEINKIISFINEFNRSAYQSMGIICKTMEQAGKLHESIKSNVKSVILLNAQSTSFSNGIIVTNASFSKGLEFDRVIIPFCSNSNYNSETDKQMLYVAATRAMHKLDITFTKELSVFLK